jgi:hypothetical protein
MNPWRLVVLAGLLGAAFGTVGGVRRADACAAPHPHNMPVAIADESAIIIWDEASKTQHFIRRVSFTTEAKDFGFLVPTPNQPELAEASDEAFKVLAKITEPKVVKQKRPTGGGGCGIGCAMPASRAPGDAMPPAGVEVLDQKRLAGQDVVVLKATDADELAKWLKDHEYEFSDDLREWVKPYLEQKWVITASKVAKAKDEGAEADKTRKVGMTAVRMTFKADKPYFPYREPAEQRAKKEAVPTRLLRVFFLSTGKVQGKLGDKGEAWPGTVAWANKIEPADREKILELLKLAKDTPPTAWWLTEFEDRSSPRPGTDEVYFSPADDQNPVERPAHVQYVAAPLPDCVMSYALVVYMLVPCLIRVVQRRKNRK